MATRIKPRATPPAAVAAAADTAPEDITVAGNRLRLLPDGAGRLDALEALIDGATSSLRVLYYIFADDRSGIRIRDALVRAAGRGVAVALLVDGFGSPADEAFFRPLEEAGATVCRFLPRFGRRYLLRNHQKLALADEARVIVGGFNVEDSYFDDGPDGWRDLGLFVDGPAAGRLAGYFDRLHAWTTRDKAKIRDLRQILHDGSETEGPLRWLMGGPTRSLSPWAKVVRADMAGARRLAIVAAYFAPNPGLLRRIERVASTGGKATVVTAAKSDNDATVLAARHTYASLLKRGVRVFEYRPRKLHTKLFVIDDVVHIGSANFDVRSLYINCELMLRIADPAFAERLRGYVEREEQDAREVTRADHRRTGPWQRAKWTFAYFLVAVVDGNISRRLNFGLDGR